MESILITIRAWLTNSTTQEIMFIVMISAAIFIFAMGLSYLVMGASDPVKRRLNVLDARQDMDTDNEPGRKLVNVQTAFGTVSEWVIPSSEVERTKTTQKLAFAGFRSPNALQTFYGLKAIAFVILPATFLLASRWMPDLTNMQLIYGLLIGAGIGLFGSNSVLDKLVEKRIKKLRDGFPDALDLLVVCVESGLGLTTAIQRVADEIAVSHEELSLELSLVSAETRAGMDRAKALRNLADRTGLDDIRGLVSMLIQAMRFGTSIADTLRVYSEEFRDRRMQKAEEAAAKIGTKLLFPLVFCLFPSFFTVAIGPAIIRFIEVFRQL